MTRNIKSKPMIFLDLDLTSDISAAIDAVGKAFIENVSALTSFAAQVDPNGASYHQLQADKEAAIAQAKQEADALAAANAADVADKAIAADLQAKLDTANAQIVVLTNNVKQLAGLVDNQGNLLKSLLDKAGVPKAPEAATPST